MTVRTTTQPRLSPEKSSFVRLAGVPTAHLKQAISPELASDPGAAMEWFKNARTKGEIPDRALRDLAELYRLDVRSPNALPLALPRGDVLRNFETALNNEIKRVDRAISSQADRLNDDPSPSWWLVGGCTAVALPFSLLADVLATGGLVTASISLLVGAYALCSGNDGDHSRRKMADNRHALASSIERKAALLPLLEGVQTASTPARAHFLNGA
ncbi:MAG: hypothetical protein AAF654_14710 [Myxococcota bacterium]